MILVCGKRKSGKDYVVELLAKRCAAAGGRCKRKATTRSERPLPRNAPMGMRHRADSRALYSSRRSSLGQRRCEVLHLSGPLKKQYAQVGLYTSAACAGPLLRKANVASTFPAHTTFSGAQPRLQRAHVGLGLQGKVCRGGGGSVVPFLARWLAPCAAPL